MTTYEPLPLARQVEIGCRRICIDALPPGVHLNAAAGIVAVDGLAGDVLYRAPDKLYEVRATVTPLGDILVMFPEGEHYAHTPGRKENDMVALRSADGGRTWSAPYHPFAIPYSQHGFIPLIPSGSRTICSFGTQPVLDRPEMYQTEPENGPIGWLWSEDDGRTFQGPRLIRPQNDPDFTAMSVTRMCETAQGTWLLGAHTSQKEYTPTRTRQYVLRSQDQGETWTLLPGPRHTGWCVTPYYRMDEGRAVALGDGQVLLMTRTPQGHLWALWSQDDGRTWTDPAPTPLVHPDAPPMVFLLSDGRTLVCFHHNRHHDWDYTGLSGEKEDIMRDRSEIWVAFSSDGGHTWSAPRFFFANAAAPTLATPFRNHQCSYLDLVLHAGLVHLFVPHRWQQVLHLWMPETALLDLYDRED